jgi:hypothetical protein
VSFFQLITQGHSKRVIGKSIKFKSQIETLLSLAYGKLVKIKHLGTQRV